jgi:hypothetical protein
LKYINFQLEGFAGENCTAIEHILYIAPSYGPINTTISIYGGNFINHGNVRCNFGNETSPAIFVNSSLYQCKIPLESAYYTVDLELTDGTFIYNDNQAKFFVSGNALL